MRFDFCRSLKCDRLRLHKNFMLSLVIRYTVSVIYYEPYIYGNNQEKHIWYKDEYTYVCRSVLIGLMYGYVAPIFWMFLEGMSQLDRHQHKTNKSNTFQGLLAFSFLQSVRAWGKGFARAAHARGKG